MTSHWYAIADVGGNIYPGTFAKDALNAQCWHIAGDSREYSIPMEGESPDYRVRGDLWEGYADRGDHVVKCRIETNEQVAVTVEP